MAGCFVCLFGVFEFLELSVDSFVFNLLEQQVWCVQLVSCWDNIGAAELCPVVFGKINHIAKFLTAERKERLESNAEVGNQL